MRSAHAFRPAAQNGLDADLSDTDLLQDPLGVSTSAAKSSAPSREAEFDVDLFVIGGGSGGIRAARVASGHGAKVMLAEEYRLGGTCVIRGCVPKKLFVYASRFSDSFNEAAEFGWRLSVPHFDWPSLVAAKDREIMRLEGLYGTGQESAGVEVVRSCAVLRGARGRAYGALPIYPGKQTLQSRPGARIWAKSEVWPNAKPVDAPYALRVAENSTCRLSGAF